MPHEDWAVNPKVLEKNPFIGIDNTTNAIGLTRANNPHPSEIEGAPDPVKSKRFRDRLKDFYDDNTTQLVVSIIIILNGILYVIQTTAWSHDCCVHNEKAQEFVEYIDFFFLLFYNYRT